MKLSVKEFYEAYGVSLGLKWSGKGEARTFEKGEVLRPGLSLAGAIRVKSDHRVLIFGRMELTYLKSLISEERDKRLKNVISKNTPFVLISRGLAPPKELLKLCNGLKIALFKTEMGTTALQIKLSRILTDHFAPCQSVHGTLVEVYGVGVLIQGDSSVGKSEAALGLIKRGHRLVADDRVELKVREGIGVMGYGCKLNQHLLELRGIGIINVAHLYGALSVRKEVPIDIVIHMEKWDETYYYDRIGLEERFQEFLGVRIPAYVHPVQPGRDSALLIETSLLNYRLKEMGYHSAKEFNQKLLEEIAKTRDFERKI